MGLPQVLNRILHRVSAMRQGGSKGYRFHYQKVDALAPIFQPESWREILLVADLRPTDQVLDMGCAEGLVSMEVAQHVAHVDGVEIDPRRVEEARRLAKQRKLDNISFAAGSVVDYPLKPRSYDVMLLLAVLGKKTETGYVGVKELERLLGATRRQIIIRLGVQKPSMVKRSITLPEILAKMDECGFDGICFARRIPSGNLIVGNRRGTDARLGTVPPFVLVPTEDLQKTHPCLRSATIGSLRDFS